MRLLRTYGPFRGVDLRGGEVALSRSPDSLNMWKDYRLAGVISTRPSMQLHSSWINPVRGLYFLNRQMLIHTGNKLFSWGEDGVVTEVFDVTDMGLLENVGRRASFLMDRGSFQELYILTGSHYLKYDGNAMDVEGYVPTTTIARAPEGGGRSYEAVNLLNPRRINTFLADGVSTQYCLDAQDIDETDRVSVQVNGAYLKTSAYTVDYAAGKVIFNEAPAAPATDGQDNVSIRFSKTVPGYRQRIEKCTVAVAFDNRIFFSGNPDHPNMLWHSALNDPEYIPDINYYQEGMDFAPIRALVAGNNALWVFRESQDQGSAVFYHTPVLDDSYGKIYPSCHSGISTGCVGPAVNFYDDICFFSHRGMEAMTDDITAQRSLRHRSSLVDRVLTTTAGYRDMITVQWQGYLLAFMGKRCFAADSRSLGSDGYEWFLWEMEQPVYCAQVHEDVLYLGSEKGIYTLTGQGDLPSHWVTARDDLGQPQMLKTTNKRGCVAQVTGDVALSAVTAKGEREVLTQESGGDYLVGRIKCKKFKDIQLKFHSDSRFSLETATLECFVGGYVKR